MQIFLLAVHILICGFLVVCILLQSGKGGGLAGGMFGGSSSAVFGSTGTASFLTRATTYLAVAFFLTCVGLWYTSRSAGDAPEAAAERMLQSRGPVPYEAAQQPQTTEGVVPAPSAGEDAPE